MPGGQDAEDILQDVFAELVEANQLLMPIEHVTGWLFRVARNRIIDLFRRKTPEQLEFEDLLPSSDDGPDAALERQARLVQEIAREHGGMDFQWATRAEDRNRLWSARHMAYFACLQLRPGTRAVSQGLRVTYSAGFSAELHTPNSGVVVRPIRFRPAWRNCCVRCVSACARLPRMNSDPISCKRPFKVGPRSFIRNGTPASGPVRFKPSLSGSRTTSSNTSTTALSVGLVAAMPAAA